MKNAGLPRDEGMPMVYGVCTALKEKGTGMTKFRKIREKLFLVKGRDIASLFLLPFAAVKAALMKKKGGKPIWLVLERSDEARDNGRAFFEYLMRYRQKEVTPIYAIQKKCADAVPLEKYGNHVVEFGSFQHIVYFLACRANISSVKNMGPNNLMGYLFRRLGIMNDKMFFLQHGITVNHPDWLEYDDARFRLVLCGAKPEYDYVRKNFGYPAGHVAYAGGLCRYDFLQDFMRRNSQSALDREERQILILPSWRVWLKPGDPQMKEIEHTDRFEETEYFRKWKEFLLSDDLRNMAESRKLRFVFYPHPTMQKYMRNFAEIRGRDTDEERFTIADAKHWSLNRLIAESDALVTDYSSVFLDFVYMRKPLVFYQFDRKKFRRYHYREGYFSYEKNPFGHACETVGEVRRELERIADGSFRVSEKYLEAQRRYFPVYDDKNCERTWEKIKACSR